MIMLYKYFQSPYVNPFLRKKVKKDLKPYIILEGIKLIPVILIAIALILSLMDVWSGYYPGKSFFNILKERHIIWIVFGITGLIVNVIGYDGNEDLANLLYPLCGKQLYSRGEVDFLANAADSRILPLSEIIIAPEIIIGYGKGVRVIRYNEVYKIRITRRILNFKESGGKSRYGVIAYTKENYNINLAELVCKKEEISKEIDIIVERCKASGTTFKETIWDK